MWWMFLSAAWAAPLSAVADAAVALQRDRGEPVLVALPDAETEAAWSRLELPSGVILIPTRASSAAEAFAAVRGVECGVLVTGVGPDGYGAEPIGTCDPNAPSAWDAGPWLVPDGWSKTHNWSAFAISASTLVLAPKLHARVPTEYGMVGFSGGFSWWGPRVSAQLSTLPRGGGRGAYLGGEVMLRTIHTMTVSGAQESAENSKNLWGLGYWWSGDDSGYTDEEELYRTAFGFGVAPIVGYQLINEGGLFLSAQAGPQLLRLIGNDWVWPVQVRVSGQLMVGFVPKRWRGKDQSAG